MNELIVVINGSRQFQNYSFLEEKCYEILTPYIKKGVKIIIREGNAKGADTLAARFAKENNFNLEVYQADWSLGRYAGFKRNLEMLKGKNRDKPCQLLISFNMGTPGTTHTINCAKELNIPIFEFKIN